MNKKFAHFFLPIFILSYFFLAFVPIFKKETVEIFPFFSFKLYSKIPNGFIHYDILLNKGEDGERFLLFKNQSISKLERKSYFKLMGNIGEAHKNGELGKIDLNRTGILTKANSVHLVRLSGDYLSAIRDDHFEVEVLEKLK